MTNSIRNEKGNVTIFVLSVFFLLMIIVFFVLLNFAKVFIDKQQASNSADQASLAATKLIYDKTEEAIKDYDLYAILNPLDPYVPIGPDISLKEQQLKGMHPNWSKNEIRYAAIDDILTVELSSNVKLQSFILAGLQSASSEMKGTVNRIITDNGATPAGTTIDMFAKERVEVKTSVRYETIKDEEGVIPHFEEQVFQIGKSREIDFVDNVYYWIDQKHEIN
ncbi:Tad domain-containing protein [Bacillus tianshenii]|nr:Tad domain-containing protein [Bacillus tianshenii]